MSIAWNLVMPFESVALVLLKGAIILFLTMVLALLLKRTAAATRHWVLMTGIGLLLVLPVLVQLFPSWTVEMETPLSQPASEEWVVATSPIGESLWPESDLTLVLPESDLVIAQTLGPVSPITWYDAAQQKISSLHWTQWLLGIWVVGIVLSLCWILLGIAGVFFIASKAEEVEDPAWTDLVEELVDRFYLGRSVKLLQTTRTLMPVTWGFFRPIILLPVEAEDWSEERRRYVLTHEFAHIARWDCLTQLFSQFALAIHWFNPLVWWTNRRLRLEQEKACDDRVIEMGLKPSVYAQHLLDIARSVQASWISPISAVAMARPSQLEGRLLSILNGKRDPRAARKNRIVATALMLALVFPMVALTPVQPVEKGTRQATIAEGLALAESYRLYQESVQSNQLQRLEEHREEVALLKKELAERNQILRQTESLGNELINQEAILKALQAREQFHLEREKDFEYEFEEANPFLPVYSDQDTTDEDRERARKRAAEAARKALQDSDEQVRYQALQSLYRIMPEESIDDFIQVLRDDESPRLRRYAGQALTQYVSDEGIDALVEALADEDVIVRRTVADGLEFFTSEKVRVALARTIESDKDYRVRMEALKSLAKYSAESNQDAFKKALYDEHPEVRIQAMKVLYGIDDMDVIEVLSELLLEDEDPKVRTFAAKALGNTRNIRAVDALSIAIDDESPEVRKAAAQALQVLDYDGTGMPVRFNATIDSDRWDEFGQMWEERLAVPLAEIGETAGQLALSTTTQVMEELSSLSEDIAFNIEGSVGLALSEAQAELQEEMWYLEKELQELTVELMEERGNRRSSIEAEKIQREMDKLKAQLNELREKYRSQRPVRINRFPQRMNREIDRTQELSERQLQSLERHLKAANMEQVRELLFLLGDNEREAIDSMFTEYVDDHAGGVECEEALEALATSGVSENRALAEELSCDG